MGRFNVYSLIATGPFVLGMLFVSVIYQGCGKGPAQNSPIAENLSILSTPTAPTFSALYSDVFSQVCIQCHYPGGSAMLNGAEVDFSTPELGYSTLTKGTVKGIEAGSGCSGVALIKAGASAESYALGLLIESENGQDYNPGGEVCRAPRFHIEASFLQEQAAKAMVQWIDEGAKNN